MMLVQFVTEDSKQLERSSHQRDQVADQEGALNHPHCLLCSGPYILFWVTLFHLYPPVLYFILLCTNSYLYSDELSPSEDSTHSD